MRIKVYKNIKGPVNSFSTNFSLGLLVRTLAVSSPILPSHDGLNFSTHTAFLLPHNPSHEDNRVYGEKPGWTDGSSTNEANAVVDRTSETIAQHKANWDKSPEEVTTKAQEEFNACSSKKEVEVLYEKKTEECQQASAAYRFELAQDFKKVENILSGKPVVNDYPKRKIDELRGDLEDNFKDDDKMLAKQLDALKEAYEYCDPVMDACSLSSVGSYSSSEQDNNLPVNNPSNNRNSNPSENNTSDNQSPIDYVLDKQSREMPDLFDPEE